VKSSNEDFQIAFAIQEQEEFERKTRSVRGAVRISEHLRSSDFTFARCTTSSGSGIKSTAPLNSPVFTFIQFGNSCQCSLPCREAARVFYVGSRKLKNLKTSTGDLFTHPIVADRVTRRILAGKIF